MTLRGDRAGGDLGKLHMKPVVGWGGWGVWFKKNVLVN